MPAARSPAQIEASRRNGARSHGPVTAEGKAKASRNALKHGLTAMHHLVLEDEAPSELEELTARLMAEVGPMSEIEARLARRLAIAFWKGEPAEKIEVALFDAAPKSRMNGYRSEEADPLTTFDLRRFNAVRGYQAQQGREISRCLKELRALAGTRWRRARANPRGCRKTNPGARSRPPTTSPAPPKRPSGAHDPSDPDPPEPVLRARRCCWRPTTGRAWLPSAPPAPGARGGARGPRLARSARRALPARRRLTAGAPPAHRPCPRSGPSRPLACSSTNTCA